MCSYCVIILCGGVLILSLVLNIIHVASSTLAIATKEDRVVIFSTKYISYQESYLSFVLWDKINIYSKTSFSQSPVWHTRN